MPANDKKTAVVFVPDKPVIERPKLMVDVDRRKFLRNGMSLGALTMLTGCDISDNDVVQQMFSRVSRWNNFVQEALFSRTKLAPEFPESMAVKDFRYNAWYQAPLAPVIEASAYKLELAGLIADKRPRTVRQLYAMPQRSQVTRHVCVEGWSMIGKWTGTPLKTFLNIVGADTTAKYVGFVCADGYYESIDMPTALHPQTIMAFQLSNNILPTKYGFPFKIRIPTKLGFKQPKFVTAIYVTNRNPAASGWIVAITGSVGFKMDQSASFDEIWSVIEHMQNRAPILDLKSHAAPSVFLPENMLREARRQKNLSDTPVPPVCILDPDGDLLRQLQHANGTTSCGGWACYHTTMHAFKHAGMHFGIIGGAVGAAFAVLLAEQAFASGCELLISLTSAGQITASERAPYFILIERALRDEGTSYHYLAPSRYAEADPALTQPVLTALQAMGRHVHSGATWTTDAPFRETETAVAAARAEGILAVEMEAAALYAFARASGNRVLCFAQVTNQMGQINGDFEKGEANGAHDALSLISIAAHAAMTAAAK